MLGWRHTIPDQKQGKIKESVNKMICHIIQALMSISFNENLINVNGLHIHYYQSGSRGKPVILLHGGELIQRIFPGHQSSLPWEKTSGFSHLICRSMGKATSRMWFILLNTTTVSCIIWWTHWIWKRPPWSATHSAAAAVVMPSHWWRARPVRPRK